MNLLLAFDSFKESLSSRDAARHFATGFSKAFPGASFTTIPIADGGEGTAEALISATGGKMVKCSVTGPLGEATEAEYGMLGDGKTAVIETAKAIGLPLVPQKARNPMQTSSYGAGELICRAKNDGARRFMITLGGSATVDGGIGLGQAMGIRFLDAKGQEIPSPAAGQDLGSVSSMDTDGLPADLRDCEFVIASDVTNRLTGPKGAAAVFGPQKGATPDMVTELDSGLENIGEVILDQTEVDVAMIPGSGAAGGMGILLMALVKAKVEMGIEVVLRESGFAAKCEGADMVVTGEGRLDAQTAGGKAVAGIASSARKQGKTVIAVAGSCQGDPVDFAELGIDRTYSLMTESMSVKESMARAIELMQAAGKTVAEDVQTGKLKPASPAHQSGVEQQLALPQIEQYLRAQQHSNYDIRKGLYVRSVGDKGQIYQITKTTRKKAFLKPIDGEKIVVMQRDRLLSFVTPLGHKLD